MQNGEGVERGENSWGGGEALRLAARLAIRYPPGQVYLHVDLGIV